MDFTIKKALLQGVAAHKEGKLEEAERLYRVILETQPTHPEANHNLGVLAVSLNMTGAALPLFKTALETNPKIEQFWLSYIDALIEDNQFRNARQVIEEAKEKGLVEENALGLKLSRIIREFQLQKESDIPHRKVLPIATYAPWAADGSFKNTYEVVRNYTLVDEYRLFELRYLALQASQLNGDFLEVGVWRGGSSAVVQSARLESKHSSRFYIADTFIGVVKAGSDKDTNYEGGEHADASINDVNELFDKLNIEKPEMLVGIFPDDHPNLNIEKLAFVHSDVDAYESSKGVIEWCLPKMVSGGVIIFDDYGFSGCEGVTRYVNELFKDAKVHSKFLFIQNLNGHAVMVRR